MMFEEMMEKNRDHDEMAEYAFMNVKWTLLKTGHTTLLNST